MMTFDEVYKQVKEYLQYYSDMNEGELNFSELVDYYTIIDEALEKQKAKKPKEVLVDEHEYINWVCANCGAMHTSIQYVHYCSSCGQAIDWK